MRQNRRFLCGCPRHECEGSDTRVNKGVMKSHESPKAAFKCYRAYLLRTGYKETEKPAELKSPDGTRLMLTGQTKFGSELRPGKRGGVTEGQRWTHRDRIKGTIL